MHGDDGGGSPLNAACAPTPLRSVALCGMQAAVVGLPALAPRAGVRRGAGRAPQRTVAAANRGKPAPREDTVRYGSGWYESTKRLSKRKSTAETLGAPLLQPGLRAQRHVPPRAARRAVRARTRLAAAWSHPRRVARACSRVPLRQRPGECPRRGGRMCATDAASQANNGKERKDLYSDNWDGDVYKGAPPRAAAPRARRLQRAAQTAHESCLGVRRSPRRKPLTASPLAQALGSTC